MEGTPTAPVLTRRAHLATFLGALFACVLAVLWMARPYLLPLFLGGTLAVLTYPVYRWFRAKRCGAWLAAAAVTLLLLLLIIAPLTGFSILAVKQGIAVSRDLTELAEFSPQRITRTLSRRQLVKTVIGDRGMVDARVKSSIRYAGRFIGAAVLKLGAGIPSLLLQLALALIAFIFFLVDGKRFLDWLLGLGALDRDVQETLIESFRETAISSVLSGLAAAASQAALIILGFLLIEVPGAFLAGGLTFIFAWIPMLGTVPASLAGMLYLYAAHGPGLKMALMLALALAAGVIDNLVRPMVLKGRADMHPLLGLIAILGGIQMFGILGLFIGPILAAMLLSLLEIWPAIRGRLRTDPLL